MQFATLPKISAIASLLMLSACQSRPLTIHHASGCADLVPSEWDQGVPSAALPLLTSDATEWRVFGVRQTGQLDKSNGRYVDALGIMRRCEARDKAVVERLQAPWWKRPFLRQPDPG